MAQQSSSKPNNWNNPAGGNAIERLQAGVNEFTEEQCREVIWTLHSMHTSFDEIIQSRDAIGTFNGSSQVSFEYRITLERYLLDNNIDINNVGIAQMCDLLFDNPGRINDSNGLLGWYFVEATKPILCQIISPWDEVRSVQVNQLDQRTGNHYVSYQLKRWVDKYRENWALAQEYEDAYNAEKAAVNGKKLSNKDLKALVLKKNPNIKKKTNFPFLPEACGEIEDYNDSTKIANLLWEKNWLLDETDTGPDVLQGKIQAIMDKSITDKRTPFSGRNTDTISTKSGRNMSGWLNEGRLSQNANAWMCEDPQDCFDEIEGPGCNDDDKWDPNDDGQQLKIQVLTRTAEEPFSFTAIGEELILNPAKFNKFFLLPLMGNTQNFIDRIITGNPVVKDDFFFELNQGVGITDYTLDFEGDEQVMWRRYLQGTIRDDYDKFGNNPTNQLEVKTARKCPPCDEGSNAFGDPRRNATPAIMSKKKTAKGALVCAICCKKPRIVRLEKDRWGEVLNPTVFAVANDAAQYKSAAAKSAAKKALTQAHSQEYDVDHIANLIFNALLNLNHTGLGFLNTCAGCNRHLKGEKLWSPSIDLWKMLLNRAGLEEGTYPWPGRNSPGLLDKGSVSQGVWKETVFEGNRVYTIKAFHRAEEEKARFTIQPGGKKMSAGERKLKIDELKARKVAFLNGQGITNPKSSAAKKKSASARDQDIPPELLELVILDRYMRAIWDALRADALEKNVLATVITEERDATVRKGVAGKDAFVRAYAHMVKVFPATSVYEGQMTNVYAGVRQSRQTNRLNAETEEMLALSPENSRDGFTSSASSHDSMPGTPRSDFGSQLSDVDIMESPGMITRSESLQERINQSKKNVRHAFSTKETAQSIRDNAVMRATSRIEQGANREVVSRVAHGTTTGLVGWGDSRRLENTTVDPENTVLDPLRNVWNNSIVTDITSLEKPSSDTYLTGPEHAITIYEYIMTMNDIFFEYITERIDDQSAEETQDWFTEKEREYEEEIREVKNVYKENAAPLVTHYENLILQLKLVAKDVAKLEQELEVFISSITKIWEPHFTYQSMICMNNSWLSSFRLLMKGDNDLFYQYSRQMMQINAMLTAAVAAATSHAASSPARKKTFARVLDLQNAAKLHSERVFREKRKTIRAKIVLLIISKMKALRDKRIAQKKAQDMRMSNKKKRAFNSSLLRQRQRRLTKLDEISDFNFGGIPSTFNFFNSEPLRPKALISSGIKKRRTGDKDGDTTMGDAFNTSGSGSGSGSGSLGVSSSVSGVSSSGSDSGSDSGTCEIPALTQDENAEFINLIHKDSTHEDGSPYSGAAKRDFEDQARRELRHTPSSYKPQFPLLNNMALEIFKLRMDWANGEINYIDTALYQGFLATGQGHEVARDQARNGADSAEATTNFLLTEDMVPQWITVQGQKRERERIHWWSGELILAALKKYCPIGGWDSQLYDREGINTRIPPTIIQSDLGDGNIQLRLIGGHWRFYTRVSESAGRWYRIRGERIGGDCGPSAVVMAINKYNEQRAVPMNMDTGQGGGKRKTRKKYKRKYRKKTRRK